MGMTTFLATSNTVNAPPTNCFRPIDFQVREPVQPIFANLNMTNSMIELEVAQEYLGQQDHGMFI
jgi:alpha-glucuronidase